MSEKLLEIKDERLSFFTPAGEVKALNGVTLSMDEGEVLGIVGESGSGKSVTAYSVMGLTAYPGRLIGGTIRFNGHQIDTMTEKEFRKIRGNEVSIIFQDPMTSLNPVYSIGNQIEESILLHTDKTKAEAKERSKELLELVGINEPEKRLKQYPHELSGGMRQRVMIAIALACEPKLLIADEPTTALDVTIQAQILELMQELRKKLGMSIIMITHDLGVVASMCEKIAVMYAGHIVEYGTADEIFYSPKHEYTKGLIKSIPKLNAEEKERLVPIEGQPVDLLNPPAGCPFAPRCASCMKICLREMPPKEAVALGENFVTCNMGSTSSEMRPVCESLIEIYTHEGDHQKSLAVLGVLRSYGEDVMEARQSYALVSDSIHREVTSLRKDLELFHLRKWVMSGSIVICLLAIVLLIYLHHRLMHDSHYLYRHVKKAVNRTVKQSEVPVVVGDIRDRVSAVLSRDNLYRQADFEASWLEKPMGMSLDEINQLLERQHTSVADIVTELRLRYACLLLETTDYVLQYIADEAGFNTLRTFYRQFKKKYKFTPTEYRRLCLHINKQREASR